MIITTLIVVTLLLINLPFVQNYLVQYAANLLSEKLNTEVQIKHVRFDITGKAAIEGLYIQDLNKDTLIYVGEFRTKLSDWFFASKAPEITYLNLNNAKVNLFRHENSPYWNYELLSDFFEKDSTKTSGNNALRIQLQEVVFNNVQFNYTDQWIGEDYLIGTKYFKVKGKDINYDRKEIILDYIKGDKVSIGINMYKGGRPDSLRRKGDPYPLDPTPFNKGKWSVSINDLSLTNSRFFHDELETETYPYAFDPYNIFINDIDVRVENIAIEADTITGKLLHLNAIERSGIAIREMKADIKVSPIISECKNLYLKTNNSIVSDYYAMHYNRFPDFVDYIDKVSMVGNFNNATIAIKDIGYFAEEMNMWENETVQLNGSAKGTIAYLNIYETKVKDPFFEFTGEGTIVGLPDIDNTIFDFPQIQLITDYQGALHYAPVLADTQSVKWNTLSQLNYEGNFNGTYLKFFTKGVIHTDLGVVNNEITLSVPYYQELEYIGHIQTDSFKIGRLFNEDKLDRIALDLNYKGSDWVKEKASVLVDGSIAQLDFLQYPYRSIQLNGNLSNGLFNGFAKVNDDNLNMEFNGIISLKDSLPVFDLNAQIHKINLYNLNLSEDEIAASGRVQADFKGDEIDNVIGKAFVQGLNIQKNKQKLNIDTLSFIANEIDGKKNLELFTNNVHANIIGFFSIKTLPQSIRLFLSHYIPEYINAPASFDIHQNFDFKLTTGNSKDEFKLFTDDLNIGEGAYLLGNLNTHAQKVNLYLEAPFIKYNAISLDNIIVNSSGDFNRLTAGVEIDEISYGKSNVIEALSLNATMYHDSLSFNIKTQISDAVGEATVNGLAYTRSDSLYLTIDPSEIYLNKDKWSIQAGNNLVVADKFFDVLNFNMESGDQRLSINDKKELPDGEIKAQVSHLNVSNISELISPDYLKWLGVINGVIYIKDVNNKAKGQWSLQIDSLNLNNYALGQIKSSGNYDASNNVLTFNPLNGLYNEDGALLFSGMLSFDSTQNSKVQLSFNNAPLKWINPFVIDYVHNISGKANGTFYLENNIYMPDVKGLVHITNATAVPDVIGVSYFVDSAQLILNNKQFELNDWEIKDGMNHIGRLNGTVKHDAFSTLDFALRFNAENINVLNLTAQQGEYFYGNIDAKVNVRLNGPVEHLNMNIFATPTKNSVLNIPISYVGDLGTYSYVHFKKKDEEKISAQPKIYKYNLNLETIATPDLVCNIILDKNTGEKLNAKGNGNLILQVPSIGDMRLNGNFEIEEGYYDFAFKQLHVLNFHKKFLIQRGSAIQWSGDIYNADLNINANTMIKARLYDLIANDVERVVISSNEIRDAQLKQDINLNLTMQGSLSHPLLKFKIDLVENRSVGTYAFQKLQRINSDEKELLNQTAALLLLEQFLPPEGINSALAVSTGTINNMSEILSGFASSQLTNITNKVLGISDLDVGVRYKNYNLSNGANTIDQMNYLNRNEAGINVRKNFFDNRLVLDVGSVYDWGRNTLGTQKLSDNIAGEFKAQYLLTEDGKFRLNMFRTSNYDAIFQQNIGRQGVGLNYRKSFNGWKDLFNLSKNKK